MNPSRVIVGEVLGDEVVTMLNAMTQGNDGSLSTIHANSSADVVHKIATYAIQAPERLPWEATVRLVATASGLHRLHPPPRVARTGQRRVVESVREIAGITEDGQLQTNELWGPRRRTATPTTTRASRSAPRRPAGRRMASRTSPAGVDRDGHACVVAFAVLAAAAALGAGGAAPPPRGHSAVRVATSVAGPDRPPARGRSVSRRPSGWESSCWC